jgi:hypothetical protein
VLLTAEGVEDMLVMAGIFFALLAFEHLVDAGLTYFMAKKGLTPRGRVE